MDILMQSDWPGELRTKCYGRVIENFGCDSGATQTISNKARHFLFYYIVDTPETATQITALFNENDLPGEINFFALSAVNGVEYDGAKHNDIVSQMVFDDKLKNMIHVMFQEACLCDRLDSDNFLVSSEPCSIDCIESFRRYTRLSEQIAGLIHDLRENEFNRERTENQLAEATRYLNDNQKNLAITQDIQNKIKTIELKMDAVAAKIDSKKVVIEKHSKNLQDLMDRKGSYENELELPFLSEADEVTVNSMDEMISAQMASNTENWAKIQENETQQSLLEAFIEENLLVRKRYLEKGSRAFISDTETLNNNKQQLEQCENSLIVARNELDEVEYKIKELSTTQNVLKEKIVELNVSKREHQEKQKEIITQLQMMSIQEKNLVKQLQQLNPQSDDIQMEVSPNIQELTEEEVCLLDFIKICAFCSNLIFSGCQRADNR